MDRFDWCRHLLSHTKRNWRWICALHHTSVTYVQLEEKKWQVTLSLASYNHFWHLACRRAVLCWFIPHIGSRAATAHRTRHEVAPFQCTEQQQRWELVSLCSAAAETTRGTGTNIHKCLMRRSAATAIFGKADSIRYSDKRCELCALFPACGRLYIHFTLNTITKLRWLRMTDLQLWRRVSRHVLWLNNVLGWHEELFACSFFFSRGDSL